MDSIPIYRAAHLLPYLHYLRNIGVPVERGLRRAKLPTMLDDRSDVYLPLLPSLAFLKDMSNSEGVDELSLRAVQRMKITDFSERLIASLYRSPTLYAALESFRKLSHLEDPCILFLVSPGKRTVELSISYRFPLDAQSQRYEDWSNILTLLTIVRMFAGQTWYPNEIALRSNVPLGKFALEQFPNTQLLFGQKVAGFTVPRDLLSLPPRVKPTAADAITAAKPTQANNTETRLPDLVDILKKVLPAYLRDGYPSVDLVAEIAGTSVRTLQRRLKQSQMTYSELVQHTRFATATQMLRDTGIKTLDIAYDLGYEDPSHFARAFRRIAGVSPREYRSQHRLN